jgi:putative membrane protein
MMKKFLSQILSAILGLWLASAFVPGVEIVTFANSNFFGFSITSLWQMFIVLGFVLGALNYFVGPLIKSISLPLEIITFGLFSLVINAGFIWFLGLVFDEVKILWMWPLIWTTLIVWALNFIIAKILIKKDY